MILPVFSEPDKQLHTLQKQLVHFCTQNIMPLADIIEQEDHLPQQLWQELAHANLLGLTAPAEYGGTNRGYLAQVIAMEHISHASAAVGLSYAAHANLCIDQINRYGSSTQKTCYLPELIQGKKIGALAMSEENAGSDVINMQLCATFNGKHYLLNGHKMWITNGPSADVIIVYAKTPNDIENKQLTAFLIEKDFPGFHKEKKFDKLGMRGSETCKLIFKNCPVPAKNVLGSVGTARQVLMSGLDYERLVLAAGPIGIMQRCFDTVLPHVTQRQQFGKALGEFQLIQAKLANMYTAINSSRAYVYALAKLADLNQLQRKDAASAILYTSEQATQVALDAIQCLGAKGYMNYNITSRLLRDAKLYEIGAGTCEIRRLLIGRDLLKHNNPHYQHTPASPEHHESNTQ